MRAVLPARGVYNKRYMKRTFFIAALAALVIPLSASALTADDIRTQIQSLMQQIQQLQEQIRILTASTTTPVACTMDAKICSDGSSVGRVGPRCEFAACPGSGGTDITVPAWCKEYARLTFGAQGQEVSALQAEIGEKDLGSAPTGYYGKLTRDVWNRRCVPHPVDCSVVKVKTTCSTGETLIGYGDCGGAVCRPVAAGGITISSFSGPSTLAIGQQGTWSVAASDSQDQQLSYHIMWGDERLRDAYSQIKEYAEASVTQQTTFTHSYAQAGTYTVAITVTNTAGAVARTTTTVRVGALECPVYNRPECLNGNIQNVINDRGCSEPRCVMQNCPVPSCMALECPAGQHNVSDTPVYGANGCRTNSCAQHCVPDSSAGCAGPVAGGGATYDKSCPNPPIVNQTTRCAGPFTGGISAECASVANQNIRVNGTATQDVGPLTGGGVVSGRTCTANGMIFAEGASVSQCIASSGANGCYTFSVTEPRFVCRGGVWVQ